MKLREFLEEIDPSDYDMELVVRGFDGIIRTLDGPIMYEYQDKQIIFDQGDSV